MRSTAILKCCAWLSEAALAAAAWPASYASFFSASNCSGVSVTGRRSRTGARCPTSFSNERSNMNLRIGVSAAGDLSSVDKFVFLRILSDDDFALTGKILGDRYQMSLRLFHI